MSKPKLLVVSTGGTITMTSNAGASGIAPTLTAADLLQAVPQIAELAEIEALTFSSMPGASLTLENIIELAQTVTLKLGGDIAGAIVIQGTDTIEETAFLLNALVGSDKPVVVTGAMRGAQAAGADGPANLLASVVVATSDAAMGRGTLVVLNDQVHSARFVKKGHTALPSSFVSPTAGPVGLVYEHRVLFTSTPPSRRVALPAPSTVHPIAVIKVSLGDDGRQLSTLRELGYRGAVIEAMGAGHVPSLWADPLAKLALEMPVVLAVRTLDGPVFTKTYGFSGSEIDLIGRGLIPAGLLDSLKARLLLSLLIGNGRSTDEVRADFARWGYQ